MTYVMMLSGVILTPTLLVSIGFAQVLENRSTSILIESALGTFIAAPNRAPSRNDELMFFNWAYANGDNMALEMDYVPMPDAVVNQIQSAWASSIKDPSGKSLWAAAR